MPRYQPPKDYYTSTEVKKILNVSAAMIAHYVDKGKIRHVVPPGRKHGFYLKKDVDKLANELDIFFNLDENVSSRFMPATEEDLPELLEIAQTLFSSGRSSGLTSLERRVAWLKKNPNIYYVLKLENQIIGYASILPLKRDTDKIEKILKANFLGEVNITPDDIEVFESGKHIHIYITAVGMKPSIIFPKRRVYASRLISNLIETIIELGKKGVIIETIVSRGDTPDGVRLLRHFGFTEITLHLPTPGRPFILRVEESGLPLISQYRKALKESELAKTVNA